MSLVIWCMCTDVSPFLSKKVTCQWSVLLIANEDGNWSLELKLRKKQTPLLFIQPMAAWLECSVEVLRNGSYYPQWPPKGFCSHPTENAKQIDWVRVAVMTVHLGSGWPLQWAAVIRDPLCSMLHGEGCEWSIIVFDGIAIDFQKTETKVKGQNGSHSSFSHPGQKGPRVWLLLLSSGFHSRDFVLSACSLCLSFLWFLTDSLMSHPSIPYGAWKS